MKTSKPKAGGWKKCSRGHAYRGDACPICWPKHHQTKRRIKKSA